MDKDEFEKQCTANFGLILCFLKKRLPEKDAEDVLQEIFMAALKSLKNYDSNRSFKSWVFRIAVRKLIDFWKRKKKEPPIVHDNGKSLDIFVDGSGDPTNILLEKEMREDHHKCLEELPDREKDLIINRYYGQLDYGKISQIFNITKENARALVHRGIKKIRDCMRRKGHGM